MKELKLEYDTFYLNDEPGYKYGDFLFLEITPNIFVKVKVIGTMGFKGVDKKLRGFKIIK